MALASIASQNNLPVPAVVEDAAIFVMRRERQELLFIIKILVDELHQTDPYILVAAKKIIKDCIDRNREGEKEYRQLAQVTKRLLKAVVGDYHWRNVLSTMQVLKSKKNQMKKIGKHKGLISGNRIKAEIR